MKQAELEFARSFPLLHFDWTERIAANSPVPRRIHEIRRRIESGRNPFDGARDETLAGYDVEPLLPDRFPAVWNAWVSAYGKSRDRDETPPSPRLLLERYLRLEKFDAGLPVPAWEAFTMRKLGGRTPYGEPLPRLDPDFSRWRPWSARWSDDPSGAPHPWLGEYDSAPVKEAIALLGDTPWRDIVQNGREIWPLPEDLRKAVGLP